MIDSKIELVLNAMGKTAIRELESKLAGECAQKGVWVTDIVGSAYSYVLGGVLKGQVPVPESTGDLFRLMASKAHLLLKDAYRARVVGHGRRSAWTGFSLDAPVGDSEITLMDHHSFDKWQEAEDLAERTFQHHISRLVLDKVYRLRKVNPTNAAIFQAAFMDGQPRDEVAKMYNTSRNNVDQIVYRVRQGLREDGPALFRQFYDEAA